MNVVFWFLVIITLIVVWFCMSYAFKDIGEIGLRLFNDAKKEIMDDESVKETENRKETTEDEG